MTSKIKYILLALLLVIISLAILVTGWSIISNIFFPKHGSWIGNLQLYQWTAIGIIAFYISKRFLKENLRWFETFTHELTHTLIAILFFRRIHSFEAKNDSGLIMSSGNDKTLVFVDLAPYCLPIYTYILLAFRSICYSPFLWCIDIIIGVSIAFHISTFKNQIGNYQTDINKRPLYFSYTYITTALLFNFCVVIVSYWSTKNVFTAFWFVCKGICSHLILW
jgi:hypothetical protein